MALNTLWVGQNINVTYPSWHQSFLIRQLHRGKKYIVKCKTISTLNLFKVLTLFCLAPDTSYHSDFSVPYSVRKVVLCSGKHYYALAKHRETLEEKKHDTAIIRVEELCPFPLEALQQEMNTFPDAKGEKAGAPDKTWPDPDHLVWACFANMQTLILRYPGSQTWSRCQSFPVIGSWTPVDCTVELSYGPWSQNENKKKKMVTTGKLFSF